MQKINSDCKTTFKDTFLEIIKNMQAVVWNKGGGGDALKRILVVKFRSLSINLILTRWPQLKTFKARQVLNVLQFLVGYTVYKLNSSIPCRL